MPQIFEEIPYVLRHRIDNQGLELSTTMSKENHKVYVKNYREVRIKRMRNLINQNRSHDDLIAPVSLHPGKFLHKLWIVERTEVKI